MAQNDAWITGVDNVCAWYEEMCTKGRPYFSVWMASQLRFSFDGDSIEQGEKLLRASLESAAQSGMSKTMILRLHKTVDRDGFVSQKTGYYASIPFRACGVDEDEYYQQGVGRMAGYDRFSQRLAAIEGKLEDNKPQGIAGMIEGIVCNEQVQPLLAQAVIGTIMGVINKFVPGIIPSMANPAMQMAPAMAGVPADNQVKDIDWALGVLEKADPQIDDDLVKLAEIAQANPQMFAMLIQSLRNFNL